MDESQVTKTRLEATKIFQNFVKRPVEKRVVNHKHIIGSNDMFMKMLKGKHQILLDSANNISN